MNSMHEAKASETSSVHEHSQSHQTPAGGHSRGEKGYWHGLQLVKHAIRICYALPAHQTGVWPTTHTERVSSMQGPYKAQAAVSAMVSYRQPNNSTGRQGEDDRAVG